MSGYKRPFDATSSSPARPHKAPRLSSQPNNNFHPDKACVPKIKHKKHPDSGVGRNFHSVPYPLSLLPLKSWKTLHGEDNSITSQNNIICSTCRKPRTDLTAHQTKLFLVAERLSWEDGTVGSRERARNEETLWEVNAELGIYEPAVEEDGHVVGGKRSKENKLWPYNNAYDADVALKLIEKVEVLTERNWELWKSMVDRCAVQTDAGVHNQEQPSKTALELDAKSTAVKDGRVDPSVISQLAKLAQVDQDLRALMKVVASGGATTDQLKQFQTNIDALAEPKMVSVLAIKAKSDPNLRILLQIMSSGTPTPEQIKAFQRHMEEARKSTPVSFTPTTSGTHSRTALEDVNGNRARKKIISLNGKEPATSVLPTPPSSAQSL